MTKEELKSILKQFEYETFHKRMKITQFHDTYIVCRFEEIVYERNPRDPADIEEDVEVIKEKISLIDIAKAIDEMPSAYWHTIAMDIKEWYSLHESIHKTTKLLHNAIERRRELLSNEDAKFADVQLHHLDRMIDIYEWELDALLNK